ncbi:adenylate/guanylate cyclase domain-containing protein [Bacteroidota bacterium]
MTLSRQLAAIMFTDIEGYTTLMQQNENRAIKVRDKHRQIFNSITKKHKGKILQYYGDGTLSIFDSAIDAVNCGIEMQLGFQKDPTIPVRIGIHTGDIIFSEEEIIGDGVNVASRIESLAVSGSVFVSDKVYDEIKNQDSIKTSMLKTFKLKNVEKPVEVYAISNVGLIVPKPEEITGKTDYDPGTSPEEPVRPESEVQPAGTPILATKLFMPPPRPNIIHRSRLINRLNEGLHGKLTLISAPPGFGKTTLVSEWVADCNQPTTWVSLDEGDNDPIRFITYLNAAIRKIAGSIGEGVSILLQSSQSPPIESILTSLVNEFTSVQEEFTLILDDYHVIDTKSVDDALTFILDHMPPQMHLVITTREDPNLPLPRLRVRGQLTELRAADMRFTPSEAAGFFNQVMGLNLSEDDINVLETRTEGWIAGLQLAALSMQEHRDVSGFIKSFAGHDRYIVDYLVEEVLQRQDGRIRNFMLQTSILDRLNGSLCNAVTGQGDGRKMLEALERGNLFVIPLDDSREWYRYHHLFADVLRSHLMEETPDTVPILHQQASIWYEQNDLPAEAIHHALTARDFEKAASLAELAWPVMDKNLQTATWLNWVKTLPDETVHARPVLMVGCAWSLLNEGELEAADTRLREAEQLLETSTDTGEGKKVPSTGMVVVDEKQFQSLPASIANARAYHAQALGDMPGTMKYAQQALDLLPEGDYIERGIPVVLMGFGHWANGDLEEAFNSFKDFRESILKADNISIAIGVTFLPAGIRIAQGQLQEAIKIYKQSLKLASDHGMSVSQGMEELYMGLSILYSEQGDLETASQYLVRSEELYDQLTLPESWKYRLSLAQSRLMEIQGDLEAALDLLDKAEQRYHRSPIPDICPVASLKTRVWIKQGKLTEALDWANERNLSVEDDLSYMREFEHITLARILIAKYKSEGKDHVVKDAMVLLDRLLKAAEEGKRLGAVIEILILQALAYEAQDNISKALSPLERALALAEPEVYVRIFVDEGIPMADLLSEAVTQRIMPDYTGRLLEFFKDEK